MTKELQDLAWSVLPKEFKEEVKFEYHRVATKASKEEYDLGFMHAHEGMFGIHDLTSDAEGEDEMLTVPRKAIIQAYAKSCTKRATKYDVGYADCLYNLFGSKCLPDEVKPTESGRFEPKQSEPKFKAGDEVVWDKRIIAYVDEILNDGDYIIYTRIGNRYTVHESDLEPYIEPTRIQTCTDDCPSQCSSQDQFRDPAKMMDGIIKDGFRKHNRLHIAAMAMAGILANPKVVYGKCVLKEDRAWVVEMSLSHADALMKAAGKGGGK